MYMIEKHELIKKARRVIRSCETMEQMVVADRYVDMVIKYLDYDYNTGLYEEWVEHRSKIPTLKSKRKSLLIEG